MDGAEHDDDRVNDVGVVTRAREQDGGERRQRNRRKPDHHQQQQQQSAPPPGLGESVIFCKLIRDKVLAHLNPWKLHDLQCVLEMRCYGDLLSDVDLKEVYFQQLWGFEEKDFLLANWREMSVNAMRINVREAYLFRDDLDPLDRLDRLDSLVTREEIVDAFRELTYVPFQVVSCASHGARVLRKIKGYWWKAGPGKHKRPTSSDLECACRAGLPLEWVRNMAWCVSMHSWVVLQAAKGAVEGGHVDVLELLAREFFAGAVRLDTGSQCFEVAAVHGRLGVITYLTGSDSMYHVDVNHVDRNGYTALHRAAEAGRKDSTELLVSLGADIQRRSYFRGRTPLDEAERCGNRDVAEFLLKLGAERGLPM